MKVHCVGGQRGGRHRSVVGVGFLRLSHPRLVSILFSAPSLLQMKFFQKLFTPSLCSFWGISKPIFTSEYDITLQTNASIASNEIASATHLRIRYHTTDETRLSLATKAFCAGPETNIFGTGDERVSRWRQTRWKRAFELQLHTQLATSDFQTELLSRWSLVTTTHLQNTGAIALRRSKGI